MGRPARKDVDYFPFYIKDGRTLFILENKYDCKGTGFFTNVLRFLSRTPDHYFQIEKESDKLYFFASVKCDEGSGLDMIEIMVETGKLDRGLWVQKKVLASSDFLESIQDAYRKRLNKCITIKQIRTLYGITAGSYDLTAGEIPQKGEVDEINSVEKPQSKVKETKVKETKEDIYSRVIDYLNLKTGKNFKSTTKKTRGLIDARLNENNTEQDFYAVIDNRVKKWLTDPERMEYLRPETLFGNKFESYLQDKPHPLQGTVSSTTMENIESFKNWEPPE